MRTKEQIKEYQRQWREKNKQKRSEYAKKYHSAWYQKNREKKLKQNREWDIENNNKRKEISKRYRVKNSEKESERSRKRREKYPELVKSSAQRFRKTEKGYYSSYKFSAIRRGHAFDLSYQDFVYFLKDKCAYCGVENAMGIDRVDNEIGYLRGNCAPCCTHCNRMKWAHTKSFFLSHIQKIAKHNNMV
jgi:hypothetical protein